MSGLDDIDYSPTSPSYSPVSPSYRPAPLSPVFRSAAAEDHLPCAQPHPLDEDSGGDEEERPPPSTSRDKPDAKNKNSKEDSDSDCDEEEKKGKRVKVKKEDGKKEEEETSEFEEERSSDYDTDEEMKRVYKDENNRRVAKPMRRVKVGQTKLVIRVTKQGFAHHPSYFDRSDSLQHGGLRYKLRMDLLVFLAHNQRVMRELHDILRRDRCVHQALFDWISACFEDVQEFEERVYSIRPPMTKALAELAYHRALRQVDNIKLDDGDTVNEYSNRVIKPMAHLFVALSILLV